MYISSKQVGVPRQSWGSVLLNRVVRKWTSEQHSTVSDFSNLGILLRKPRNIRRAFGTEIENERIIELSNFIPVVQDDRISPLSTDQHHVHVSCSGTLKADPRISRHEITEMLCIHYTTVSPQLRAISKWKKLYSWLLHELAPANKNRRLRRSLSVRNTRECFLHRIVTSNKILIFMTIAKGSGQWLDRDQCPKWCPKLVL